MMSAERKPTMAITDRDLLEDYDHFKKLALAVIRERYPFVRDMRDDDLERSNAVALSNLQEIIRTLVTIHYQSKQAEAVSSAR